MFTIRKATVADCELIHMMAKEVFPATYKDILSPEQLDYMMDWMYAPSNVRKQMEEEGHVYSIAYKENEPIRLCAATGKRCIPSSENLCSPPLSGYALR